MVNLYLGLGSNLNNPLEQVHSAILALQKTQDITFVKASSCYRSKPLGPEDQPDYINAVVFLKTVLSAEQILQRTQLIEQTHGRERSGLRWGPRTLDIDILVYGDQTIDTKKLQVPHPGISEREFVLYPLLEIAPDLHIPGLGLVNCLVKECPSYELERINSG